MLHRYSSDAQWVSLIIPISEKNITLKYGYVCLRQNVVLG